MLVRKTVCEWKGIEFLPVVHQLVEEKLCAGEAGHVFDPSILRAKALYQRWCHREDMNPQQQSMLQALSDCLSRLEVKERVL